MPVNMQPILGRSSWPSDLNERASKERWKPVPSPGPRGAAQCMPQRVREVLERAAAHCGVTLAEVVGETHRSEVVKARRRAAHELQALGHTTITIGRYLGGRHHTTVLNLLGTKGARRLRAMRPTRPAWTPEQADESGIWAI